MPKKTAEKSYSYQPGTKGNKTAFLLSTPGLKEKVAKRPAAGQTGETLNMFLEIAHKKCPTRFPSTDKSDYGIVNASTEVHYKAKTGDTEATLESMMQEDNLERLTNLLKDMDTVVVLGVKPSKVADKIIKNKCVLKGRHPSMQSLRRKYTNATLSIIVKGYSELTPAKRDETRIILWTDEVLKSKK